MKASEFRKLIREEVRKVLKEGAAPNFADPKAKYIYDLVGAAIKQNKLEQLKKEFQDYSIEFNDFDWRLATTNLNKFYKQLEYALVHSDWDAVEWRELKDMQKALGL